MSIGFNRCFVHLLDEPPMTTHRTASLSGNSESFLSSSVRRIFTLSQSPFIQMRPVSGGGDTSLSRNLWPRGPSVMNTTALFGTRRYYEGE